MIVPAVSSKVIKLALTSFLFSLPLFLMALFLGSTHQVFADDQLPATGPITVPITIGCTPKPACALIASGAACKLPRPTPVGGWCN